MTLIQKSWLYLVILIFGIHLIRDILQDLTIHTFLSDMFVKNNKPQLLIFHPKNTYVISLTEIILAATSLKNNTFGITGYLTLFIAACTLIGFLVYWYYF